MKQRKRGFTLIELLAVITILAVIGLIIVPTVDSVIKISRERAYEKQKESLLTSLHDWFTDNRDVLYESDSVIVTLGDLKEQNYVDYDIKNPKTERCLSNDLQLVVTKVDKKYEYSITGDELVDGSNADCDILAGPASIYLIGNNPMNIEINSTYIEPGYTAKNPIGEDITSLVEVTNNIVLTKLGSYTVNYQVTYQDTIKSITRTVNVVDTTAPEITFPENTVLYTNATSFDVMEGVSVTDNSGSTPTVTTSGNLSLGVAGEYEVTYTVKDASGNSTTKVRKITIERARIFLRSYTNSTSQTDDFHSSTYSSKIKTVSFINNMTIPSTAIVTWDLSALKDNSIKGWIVPNSEDSTMYDLYVGSDGIILANTNSSYLFYQLSEVKTISFKNYDTSNVTTMYQMFYNCSGLTSLDVSKFDTSKVTRMYGMFYGCSSLTSLDVSKFDTSNVTTMYQMFYHCSSLTSLDVSKFDTSKVTNMSWIFSGCKSLTSLDVSKFDTSKVTNMTNMFSACIKLTSLDVSKFDTSKVTGMSYMFSGCSSLTKLDVSKFDTSKVTTMNMMFYHCSVLTSLDVSNFATSNVTDMMWMFSYCVSLTSLDVSKFDTSKVTGMSYMFYNCSKLTSLDVSKFDTSKVTKMSGMFWDCGKLTSLDLSKFDTSKVESMSGMFDGCSSITSLDLSSFDTSKVTSMFQMFTDCSSLINLNVSNFNTSNVTNMCNMFRSCSSITSLDLSSFDTSKVTDMGSMFLYASKLKTIYVGSKWTTANVTSTSTMFDGCGTSSVTLKA